MARIAFLIDTVASLTPEQTAAWRFLTSEKRLQAKRIRFDRIPGVAELRRSYDLLWWHADTGPQLPAAACADRSVRTIREYVQRGGSLLLSLSATTFITDLGVESVRPNFMTAGLWKEESWARGYPDIRGFAPYLGHPLFQEMAGGAFTWMPTPGTPFAASYYQDAVPATGRVLAVERLYIKVIPERRLIWEHAIGRGRILSIGAYLNFLESQTRVRTHLEHLMRNVVAYLTVPRRRSGRAGIWHFDAPTPSTIERNSRPVASSVRSVPWPDDDQGPTLRRDPQKDDTGNAFDVGGTRCVVLGHERTGIREVWCHPVRILRDLKTSFVINGGESVSAADLHPAVLVSPAGVSRVFHVGEAVIEELTFSDPALPAAAIRYRIGASCDVRILIDAEVDLRLMWPLNERATGGLQYAWDEGLQSAVVATAAGEFSTVLGSSVRPHAHLMAPATGLAYRHGSWVADGTSERTVRIGMTLAWKPGDVPIVVGIAGSGTSEREAELAYREIMKSPAASYARQLARARNLFDRHVALESPDTSFNDLYRFAVNGTDRFLLETPGLGTSYVAGFGTVERGWDGGHAVSGRPGYAWYFGRDAVWTAFAAIAGGLHDRARAVVEFLGRHQDLSGKILHELTTSGYAHYDAADATPLYVILFGRYVRASGHVSFARREFARLERAMAFCASTDTDGDGLIENTNVGHGWVEGGGLFPVHTEHYLASCWAEALREAAFVADLVGRSSLAKRWSSAAAKVRTTVETEFWNDGESSFRFAKLQDGSWRNDLTVLPTVGLGFGIGRADQAARCLPAYASSEFTTDWGVRIIGRSNPMFNPVGYHTGSVWPLFTGWAALAEFRYDRPLQGFLHTTSTLLTSTAFAAGSVEEVLHGDTLTPAGVCARQAWSESMILQPLLEGMLGIDADGTHHRLSLRPWIPPHWGSFAVRRIRVGTSTVSFTMRRDAGSTTLEFALEGRSAVDVRLALRFPLGTVLNHVLVGRKRIAVESTLASYGDAPTVGFRLTSKTMLVYRHSAGIGYVPPLETLTPGAVSEGLRVIEERFDDGAYVVSLENSGEDAGVRSKDEVKESHGHTFEVWSAVPMLRIEGAQVVETKGLLTRLGVELSREAGKGRADVKVR